MERELLPDAAPLAGLHLGLLIAPELPRELFEIGQRLHHTQLIRGVLQMSLRLRSRTEHGRPAAKELGEGDEE